MEDNIKITPPTTTPTGTPTITDPTPEMAKLKEDIIKKYTVGNVINEEVREKQFMNSLFTPEQDKMTATAPFEQVYAPVGNEFVARYDDYLRGADNAERSARMQTGWESTSNALLKAGVNIGTTALGSTIGAVTGASNWIGSDFEMEALYTDDFNVWLDEVNEKLNYKLPEYYTKQEMNDQSMFTRRWFNDVYKGVSFTLGAIVGEGIWAAVTGGASLSTTAARLGLRGTQAAKIARGINNYQKLGKKMIRAGYSVKSARNAAIGAEIANTMRFTYTSAGYEAGVEARQTMKEAEANFEHNIEMQYGRKPTAEERADFQEDLTTAGNAVWVSNLALVGSSNLAIFGKMFKITDPLTRTGRGMRKSINKTLFGIGSQVKKDGGRLAREALKPSTLQKTLGYTNSFAKSAVIEGFWEEGNQSVVGNIANDWLESGYDVDATKNSYDLMEGIYNGYAKTYGTAEGWREVGIGMVVGLLGGGVSGQWSSYSRALKNEKAFVEAINNDIIGSQAIADKMFTQNQIFKANLDEQKAKENGDYVGQQQARERAILSSVALHKNYDRLDEAYEDFKTALELQSSEKIAEEHGVDVETVEDYKKGVLEEYTSLQQRYSDNKDFADYVLGKGTTNKNLEHKGKVAEAIAYNMTMGENSAQRSTDLMSFIQDELSTIVTGTRASDFKSALDLKNALELASTKSRKEYEDVTRKSQKLKETKRQLEDSILDANRQLSRVAREDVDTKKADAENLLSLQKQLLEVNEQIEQVRQEKQLVLETLKVENPFAGDSEIITAEQLDRVAEMTDGKITGGVLAKIDQAIESLREKNPEKYERIQRLFKEYEKSVYSFREYHKTVQGISSDNFNAANFATKLNTIIGKNKDANEFTKEYFAKIGDQLRFDMAEQIVAAEQAKVEEAKEGDSIEETVVKEEKSEEQVAEINKRREEELEGYTEEQLQETGTFGKDITLEQYTNEKYDAEIEALEGVEKQELSPVEKLRNLINEVLKKNSLIVTYIGEDYTESQTKPTKEELEEYKALNIEVNKNGGSQNILNTATEQLLEQDGFSMYKESIERFRELNEVFAKWQIQEGVFIEGVNASLADLIERLQQYEAQPEKNNVNPTVTNTEAVKIETASDKNATGVADSIDMVQSNRGVYLKIKKNGARILSNITLIGVIERHIKGEVSIFRKNKKIGEFEEVLDLQVLKDNQNTEGEQFIIKTEQGDVALTVGDKSRLEFTKDQWENAQNAIGLTFVLASEISSANWIMAYDAEGKAAKSDFKQETSEANKIPEMTNEEMAAMESARLEIDPENSYNKMLLKKLETAETKAEIEEIKNSLVIEYVSDGKWAGNMRKGGEKLGKSPSAVNFKAIRELAFKQLKKRKNDNRIDLDVVVDVSRKFNGSPIFNLKEGQVQNSPIDSQQMQVIKDVGYVQNGVITTGGRVGDVSTSYLPKTSEKTPIVVFRYKGRNVAFPISLIQQESTAINDLTNILSMGLTEGQIVNRINDLLIRNGISPAEFNLQERDLTKTNKLEQIEARISGVPNYTSVEQLANPNYDLSNLPNDATMPIDVADNPFGSPKIKMDLASMRKPAPPQPPTREELIEKELEMLTEVNSYADALRERQEYTTSKKYTFSEFAELHANLENDDKFTSNQEVYSWKKRNVNFIESLVAAARKNKAVKEFYGLEFLKEVEGKIQELRTVQKEVKEASNINVPPTVAQNAKNQTQKPCK